MVFSGPEILGPFSGRKRHFFGSTTPRIWPKAYFILNKMCTPWIDIFYKVSSAPNGDLMQKLRRREVDVSTTPIGAHKPFGVSSPGVRVFNV
jgi:hypothetical protein